MTEESSSPSPNTGWYLVQYHRKNKKARLIDKAWFPGYALAGGILPDARFDIHVGTREDGVSDIRLTIDEKTKLYLKETLLADEDKWCQRAIFWVCTDGINELMPHEDYCQKEWLNHSVMLIRNLQWFADNEIVIINRGRLTPSPT